LSGGDAHGNQRTLSDHAIEQIIGRLLRFGVLLAAAIAIIGGGLVLAQHGGATASFSSFRGEPEELKSLAGIFHGVRHFESDAIVQLGLALLIATPVARVAFTLVAFTLQRDRTYIAITTLVLALLAYGLFFGTA
jgi:uncharacterized membrane protein